MKSLSKTQFLDQAKKDLAEKTSAINVAVAELKSMVEKKIGNRRFVAGRDRIVEAQVLAYNQKRLLEFEKLEKSPYFFKCLVQFKNAAVPEEVYISKFNFSEEKIYSWFSSISCLRFTEIGEFSYATPKGEERSGALIGKDQFMIVDGRIVYLASEAVDRPRELIYQEHLSNRKSGFVLPEVIAKMEKNQDEVIRADYRGSYLIAGPAGSGKTTLALHRVAYLAQSPDTSEYFSGKNIIVFVQDQSTLDYFKSIFPQLGIEDVIITTFYQWALDHLGFLDFEYAYRFGPDEAAKDGYEQAKRLALAEMRVDRNLQNADDLAAYYRSFLDETNLSIFAEQAKAKKLDRFDIAVLLAHRFERDQGFKKEERVVVAKKNGDMKLENRILPIEYSLIILDEAQNYLKEEIAMIKALANKNKAILYTGDLAQQTKLFTLRDWNEVGEDFGNGHKVVLDKVYRNTKEILRYVQARGYAVCIPDELKSGPEVEEKHFDSKADEINFVRELVGKKDDLTIGILNKSKEYLADYLKVFEDYKNTHVLSVSEAQGVEFDVSILVGQIEKYEFDCEDEGFKKEKTRVERDLDYVALTRAMEEMWVCFVVSQ